MRYAIAILTALVFGGCTQHPSTPTYEPTPGEVDTFYVGVTR